MSRLSTVLMALALLGAGAFYFTSSEKPLDVFNDEGTEMTTVQTDAVAGSREASSPAEVAVLVTKLDATRPLFDDDGEIGESEFPPVSVGEFLDPDDIPPRQDQSLVSVGEPRDPDDEDQRVFLTEISVGEFKDPDDELAALTELVEPVSLGEFKDPDEVAIPSGAVSLGELKDPDDNNP